MSPTESKQLSELRGPKLVHQPGIAHEILTTPARKYGSKIAVVCMHQPSDLYSSVSKSTSTAEYLRWTFNEINHVSHFMATALVEAGVRPGMKIAAFIENSIESHILIRAAFELNCPISLLNPKSSENTREVQHFFEILEPSIIMVPNVDVAERVENAVPKGVKDVLVKLVVHAGKDGFGHWQDFGTFLDGGSGSDEVVRNLNIERKIDDLILILFTSGTTSLPKGAPHTNRSWTSILLGIAETIEVTDKNVSCSHLSLFHIFGLNHWALFNAKGATAVHPAATFDAKATLKSIREEGTNTLGAVPSLISTLLHHSDFKTTDTSRFELIILGGTTILPEHIRIATKEFGASRALDSYGMTESGIQTHQTPGIVPNGIYPNPETIVRVCDPDSGKVLPRGERGELHSGGIGVVSEYLLSKAQGEEANEVFYDDEVGHWLRTGDQAIIDENGVITLVGRYKDMIIRGGENISPRSIEEVLADEFNLVAEVIGIQDSIAGEIPIAVIKSDTVQKTDISSIRGTLMEKLGPTFALEDIISVTDLGLNDFPRTSSGKTQKNKLRDLAAEYFKNQQHGNVEGRGEPVRQGISVEILTRLWSRHLGIAEDDLDPQRSIHDSTDSLVLSRFSSVLHRHTGHSLNLQELMEHPTIESQHALLAKRTSHESHDYSEIIKVHDGPPTKEDIIFVEDEATFHRIKSLSEEVLSPLGLSWNDVESVIPMQSTMKRFLVKRRPMSNNHRHTWLCRGRTIKEAEEALKKALTHHSIMRSMSIQLDHKTPVHITVRPSERFFSHCFTHMPSVTNTKELWKQSYNDPKLDWAAAPGPMFRTTFFHVEEENCAGIVYMAQHSNFDGISLDMVLQDFDAVLNDPNTSLVPRVPYKAWAESSHNLRNSLAAERSLRWHTKRLKGISNLKDSLFPKQRAPEWFKGQSDGWIDLSTGEPGPHRKAIDGGSSDGVIGITRRLKLQDLKTLRAKHGIEIPQIVKAALSIVNTQQTGSNVAMFGQYQAARTWDLPNWQANLMPDAMDVDGPTMEIVALKINVQPSQTLLEFLSSLQNEQSGLNAHSHASYDSLMEILNEEGAEEGCLMEDILRRQIFNWLPGGHTEYKSLQLVQMLSRTDVGLLWNCKMGEGENLQIHASWDDAQLSSKEVEMLLDELVTVTRYVSHAENWHKKISEVTDIR